MATELLLTNERGERRKIISQFDAERAIKIEWSYFGNPKEIIAKEDQVFIPVLLPSEMGFLIFFKNFEDFKAPCNVALLNIDGTVRHQLCPPNPISDLYKNYEDKFGSKVASEEAKFISHEFIGNQLALWIGFGYDFYEVRKINVVSGEFGECVRAARL